MLPVPWTASVALLALAVVGRCVVLRPSPFNAVRQVSAQRTCLAPEAVQTASARTGQENGTPGAQPGQVESLT